MISRIGIIGIVTFIAAVIIVGVSIYINKFKKNKKMQDEIEEPTEKLDLELTEEIVVENPIQILQNIVIIHTDEHL